MRTIQNLTKPHPTMEESPAIAPANTAFSETDCHWMRCALEAAREAGLRGEVPVGAVVVDGGGNELARSSNCVEACKDGTAHAELLALQMASRALGEWRLAECTLYVTKEPCPMCAGAMVNCRLGRLVFGAPDPRMGAAGGALDITGFSGTLHRTPVTGGVLSDECAGVLREFFRRRRAGADKRSPLAEAPSQE